MTIHEAYQQLLFQLYHIYDNREAAGIADWVMEYLTGWKKIDRIIHKNMPLRPVTVDQLERFTKALLDHTPVQYVLQEAWFYKTKWFVNEKVLIPRPETEELVEWVIETAGSLSKEKNNYSILDIGTGSGCIAVTLKKHLPHTQVLACDISAEALDVANKNATDQKVDIQFILADFLEPAAQALLPEINIIVSNPPYIPEKDKQTMKENVLLHEPHIALFVKDDDPLLFYRSIIDFAGEKLLPDGIIFTEIHEELAEAVTTLFKEKGFMQIMLKKDIRGKDRMVKAMRS